MRRLLCGASLLLPISAFLFGCEGGSGAGRTASTTKPADVAPSTLTHDHQPPPRTPEY